MSRENRMREQAEGRDDNGTDSPRQQARRGAESRAGRDNAGNELPPTCELADLRNCLLAYLPTCLLANLLTILAMLFYSSWGIGGKRRSREHGVLCNAIFFYLTFNMLKAKK